MSLLFLVFFENILYSINQALADDYVYEKVFSVIENIVRLTDEQNLEQISKIEERIDVPQITCCFSSGLGGPITVLFMTLIALFVGNTFMGGIAKYG